MPRVRTARVVELEIDSDIDWCDLQIVHLLKVVSDQHNTACYSAAMNLPGIKKLSVRFETDANDAAK